MRFATSPALSPSGNLLAAIADDYARSALLFFGDAPDLETIYRRLDETGDRM